MRVFSHGARVRPPGLRERARGVFTIISIIACALHAGAQSPAGSARVSGIVFDSMAMRPLANAVVQLARVGGSGARAVETDSAGRFVFDALPAGDYGVGFQHLALSALGLDAPLRALRLADSSAVVIDLAIPPPTHVRAITCGGALADSGTSLLAGFVTDAAGGVPLGGALVAARWTELGIVDKRFRTIAREFPATVHDDGSFQLCGIASDAQVEVRISRAGFRSLEAELTLPAGAALRRDFRLSDTSVTRGSATVSGTVQHADGSRVASGVVHVDALSLEAPITNGTFQLSALPPGTWSLEARVIGFTPQSRLVEAVEGVPGSVTFSLSDRIQMLEAVTVFGKAPANTQTLNGILERRRTAFGTTFLPGNSWLQSALHISDVLQAARGFRYLGIDSVVARGCLEQTSILFGGGAKLIYYLDGSRFSGSLEDLQHSVPIGEVLAVETYPDPQSIPALWRSNDACALVAVWTKRS